MTLKQAKRSVARLNIASQTSRAKRAILLKLYHMKKILFFALALLGLSACTTSRTFHVGVDKAENVGIVYKDSTSAVYPAF